MYAIGALWQGIYDTLNGNITGTLHESVPPGTPYPYTVRGGGTEVPDDLRDGDGSEPTMVLDTWARTQPEVDTIQAEIDALLHRQPPMLVGARCWMARRTFCDSFEDADPKTGSELRHGVVRYRFRLEEA